MGVFESPFEQVYWADYNGVTIGSTQYAWSELDSLELDDSTLIIHLKNGVKSAEAGWSEGDFETLCGYVSRDSDLYQTGYEELEEDGIVANGTVEDLQNGKWHECTVYDNGCLLMDDGTMIYVDLYDKRKEQE